MVKGTIGLICLVSAVIVCVAKAELLGYEWYFAAFVLFGVGAFLIWAEWRQWQDRRLWGKKNVRTDLTVDSTSCNIDLFPED